MSRIKRQWREYRHDVVNEVLFQLRLLLRREVLTSVDVHIFGMQLGQNVVEEDPCLTLVQRNQPLADLPQLFCWGGSIGGELRDAGLALLH